MAKAKKTVFFCQQCGYESVKWMGQCPGCREWNTFVEEPAEEKRSTHSSISRVGQTTEPLPLSKIEMTDQERFTTGIGELDRVLGGGIVPASLVLVGGDPGIGKSTLLLQVCPESGRITSQRVVYFRRGVHAADQDPCRTDRFFYG